MTLLTDLTAVVRRPAGVLRVSGHDRMAYLHSLLSQDLAAATPGTVADFLYLDAKGGALAVGRAVVRAGDVLLVVPPEVAADFGDALRRYPFLMDAVTEGLSRDWALASVRGPGQIAVPGARPEPMTAAPHASAAGSGMVVRDRAGGVDLIGETAWVEDRITALVDQDGLAEASTEDWEAWRITAGLPSWGREITAGRRPQELGLLPTHVHLRKGCYPGQESIAKVHNLGRPRRALAVLESPGPLAPGNPVEAEGVRATGEVTSASPGVSDDGGEAGGPWLALAMVPLDREGARPRDGKVSVGGQPARVRHRVGDGQPQPGAPTSRR